MTTQTLLEFRCPTWAELPNLSLYMDQVLIVIEDALRPVSDTEDALTATMVNNYVKMKLLPPSSRKKYDRAHLSALIMITLLKRVLSMSELALLLDCLYARFEPHDAYDLFCTELERGIHAAVAGDSVKPSGAPPLLEAAVRCLSAKFLFEAAAEGARSEAPYLPPDPQ